MSFTLVNSVQSFTLVNTPPPKADRFVYSVKFICNPSDVVAAGSIGLVQGFYTTDINVHNPSFQKTNASIIKKFVLATPEPYLTGTTKAPYVPATPNPYVLQPVTLGPDAAMRIDCLELELLLTTPQIEGSFAAIKGFVIMYSSMKLDVVAEYTTANSLGSPSIDVEYIQSTTFVP